MFPLCRGFRSRSKTLALLCFLAVVAAGSGLERIGGGHGGGAADKLEDLQVIDDAFHSILGGVLPVSKNQVIHSGDGQKLSRAFRAIANSRCKPDKNGSCAVSPSGLSTSGFVHYTFDSPQANIKGESFQSLLSCRCASSACNSSIAAIPVVVKGDLGKSNRRSCMYMKQEKQNKLVRCLAPLLNITKVSASSDIDQVSPLLHLKEVWTYAVGNALGNWKARGIRNTSLLISEEEFRSLPPVNVSATEIHAKPAPSDVDDIGYHNIELVRDAESLLNPENDPCSKTMDFAMRVAAWKGGEHDRDSIGRNAEDFAEQPPQVLKSIELAFISAATLIGIGSAAKILLDRSQREQTGSESIFGFFIAVCVYLVEALILYATYALTYKAFEWRGAFSHVDAVLVAFRSAGGAEFDATDSVFVLIVSLGSAAYRETKLTHMTSLMILATTMFLITVISYAEHEWRRWVSYFADLWERLEGAAGSKHGNDKASDVDSSTFRTLRSWLCFWFMSQRSSSRSIDQSIAEKAIERSLRKTNL